MDSREVKEVGDLVRVAYSEEPIVLPEDLDVAQTERHRIDELIKYARRIVCLEAVYEPMPPPPAAFAQGSHGRVGTRAIWVSFQTRK